MGYLCVAFHVLLLKDKLVSPSAFAPWMWAELSLSDLVADHGACLTVFPHELGVMLLFSCILCLAWLSVDHLDHQ